MRDGRDSSVRVDSVDEGVQLSKLILSAAPGSSYRLDHYYVAIWNLDPSRSRNNAVLLRSKLRGGELRHVSTRLDVRRCEFLLGSGMGCGRGAGGEDCLRSRVSFHCTAVNVYVLHPL